MTPDATRDELGRLRATVTRLRAALDDARDRAQRLRFERDALRLACADLIDAMGPRAETPDDVLARYTRPDGDLDVRAMAEALCVLQHDVRAVAHEATDVRWRRSPAGTP